MSAEGERKTGKEDAAVELPLSFAQQRMWFLQQFSPGDPFYNIVSAHRLRGEVDVSALEESLNAVQRRHDTLRTTFYSEEGEGRQRIHPYEKRALPVTDLSGVDGPARDEEAQGIIDGEASKPIDVSGELPWRARLIRLSPEEHILVIVVHHIASDGWSMGVLFREISRNYGASVAGREAELPELPVQYADYAREQRRQLEGAALERQLEYWRGQLRGVETLRLPMDKPRPAILGHEGGKEVIRLSRELTRALKELAVRERSTPFIVLLTIFHTLLHRYSGQDDIVTGFPMAGRNRTEVEGLIGFFVNSIVIRTRFSEGIGFRELLKRVRGKALESYEHQDIPFEKLVEELKPERDTSRNPFFQVLFGYGAVEGANRLDFPGLEIELLTPSRVSTRLDVELQFREVEGQFQGGLIYSLDLFEKETMSRLRDHFCRLAEAIVAEPDGAVDELEMMPEEERELVVGNWSGGPVSYSEGRLVHELFEERAAEGPERPALRTGSGEVMGYGELNARANRLARVLKERGVKAGDLVGLSTNADFSMVTAMLGILKAGAGYVPLDALLPRARIEVMLEDARPTLIVVAGEGVRLFEGSGVPILILDEVVLAEGEGGDLERAEGFEGGEMPAYVLFTSGSTGRPKGVTMPHQPLVNLIVWQMETSRAGEGARTLQFASSSFDVSFQEIFSTLGAGGTLVLTDSEIRRDAERLLALIDEAEVSRIFLPFVALQQLTEAAGARQLYPESLREVITAGEQLQVTSAVRGFFTRLEDCVLKNQYGPTESHVVSEYELEGGAGTWPVLPPIGKPISNARLYVLDQRLKPTPVRVAGELCIGGVSVAKGYWHRDELTAERFLPDPFDASGEGRIYRTGDLVRWLPDGNLEFLGRADQQLKVRGYRIEPGEIESVLMGHEGVTEAAVVARDHPAGGKQLVAYVVVPEGAAGEVEGIIEHAEEKLPEYMVPRLVVPLASLPLTATGKLDREKLPEPEFKRGDGGAEYVAPETALEKGLVRIWEKTLGVSRVGVKDNFFDLGGHSLLAIRFLEPVERLTGIHLPLAAFFQAPTIRHLTKLLEEDGEGLDGERAWEFMQVVQPHGSGMRFFCVHAGPAYAEMSRKLGDDQPYYAIQFEPQDRTGGPRDFESVEDLAALYLPELRRVQSKGPYCLGGYSIGGTIAYEMAQRLEAEGEEVRLLVMIDPMGALASRHYRGGGDGALEGDVPGVSEESAREFWAWKPFESPPWNLYRRYKEWREWYKKKGRSRVKTWLRRKGRVWYKRIRGVKRWAVRTGKEIKLQYRNLLGRWYMRARRPLTQEMRTAVLVIRGREIGATYKHRPYHGRVIYFKARKTHESSADSWLEFLAGETQVVEVPGDHGTLLQGANLDEVVEVLGPVLKALDRG